MEAASSQPRTLALVGPGRAGTTIALALLELDWSVVAVAGRSPDASSTAAAAACLDADATLVSDAGRGAALVIVATPDRAIEGAAARDRAVARARRARDPPRRLVGCRRVRRDARAPARRAGRRARTRCRRSRPRRSGSSGCRARGPRWPATRRRPSSRRHSGCTPSRSPTATAPSTTRPRSSPPTTSSRCSVRSSGSRARAVFRSRPSPRSSRSSVANAFGVGPARALTGPVARGDLATVEHHLATLDPGERDTYRTLAREVARLTGRRDHAIDRLLADVRHAAGPEDA